MEIKMMMKMVINTKNIYVIVTALLAALISPSCVSMGEGQDTEVGYLTIGGFDVDVTVGQLSQTRAAVLPEISEPESVIYKITDVNGASYRSDESSWQNPLILPVGKYTVEAWSGSNTFGAPYFYGKSDGTIGVESKTETVVLEVANSLVAVSVGEDLIDHFIDPSLSLSSGGTTYDDAEIGEYCFVPSGADLTITLSGKNSAETGARFEYEISGTNKPAPATAYEVICGRDVNWPEIELGELNNGAFEGSLYFSPTVNNMSEENKKKIVYQLFDGQDWNRVELSDVEGYKYISGLDNGTKYTLKATLGALESNEVSFTPKSLSDCLTATVKAEHTYESSVLTGTKVTCDEISVGLPSIIAELAEGVKVSAQFGSSTAAGASVTPVELNESNNYKITNTEMHNTDGWPYIPKGDYSFNATVTCTIPTPTGEISCSGSLKEPIKVQVPEPVFTVTVSAYTSYNKYLEGDLTFANNDANKYTVFGLQANVGISDELLSDTKYTKVSKITFDETDLGTFDTNSKSYGDKTECTSWKNYPFKASMTFDGVEKSAQKDCHITGLPYKPQTMVQDDWSLSSWNCQYVDGIIQLGGVSGSGDCTATSNMAFNVPNTINIVIKTNATVRAHDMRTNIFGSLVGICNQTTFTVSVNESTIISQYSDYQDNDNTGKNYNLSGNSSFSTDSYSIKMNSSYELAGPWSKVHSLHILYR